MAVRSVLGKLKSVKVWIALWSMALIIFIVWKDRAAFNNLVMLVMGPVVGYLAANVWQEKIRLDGGSRPGRGKCGMKLDVIAVTGAAMAVIGFLSVWIKMGVEKGEHHKTMEMLEQKTNKHDTDIAELKNTTHGIQLEIARTMGRTGTDICGDCWFRRLGPQFVPRPARLYRNGISIRLRVQGTSKKKTIVSR